MHAHALVHRKKKAHLGAGAKLQPPHEPSWLLALTPLSPCPLTAVTCHLSPVSCLPGILACACGRVECSIHPHMRQSWTCDNHGNGCARVIAAIIINTPSWFLVPMLLHLSYVHARFFPNLLRGHRRSILMRDSAETQRAPCIRRPDLSRTRTRACRPQLLSCRQFWVWSTATWAPSSRRTSIATARTCSRALSPRSTYSRPACRCPKSRRWAAVERRGRCSEEGQALRRRHDRRSLASSPPHALLPAGV